MLTQTIQVQWPDGSAARGLPREVVVPSGGMSRLVCEEVLSGESYPLILPTSEVSTVVDVGANCGMAALYFLAHYPLAEVYSFEPDAELFEILHRNVQGLPVRASNVALWELSGRMPLFRHRTNPCMATLLHDRIDEQFVPAGVTVDCVDAKGAVDGLRIDVLKIDAEGSDPVILERILPYHPEIKAVYIESHSRSDLDRIYDCVGGGYMMVSARRINDVQQELAFLRSDLC